MFVVPTTQTCVQMWAVPFNATWAQYRSDKGNSLPKPFWMLFSLLPGSLGKSPVLTPPPPPPWCSTHFLFGLVWTMLSFAARLIQAFGLGLFPGEYSLEVRWGGVSTINPTASIVLGVLCLLGFVLFDLVYLAAVINYAVQSEFNVGFLRAIAQLVQQRKYPKLDSAITVRGGVGL